MSRNAAFEVLYREFYVRVYGLCRRLLASPALAEDAAQETFTRAFRTFGRYDASRPFWSWIAAIANRHCIDVLRRQGRTDWLHVDGVDADGSLLDAVHSDEDGPEDTVIGLEDAAALNAAIERLPDRDRVVIVLAYFNECRYEEIAEQMGITRNHVGVLLLRAKRRLRAALAAPDEEPGKEAGA